MEGSIFAGEEIQNVEGTNTNVKWVVGCLEEKCDAFRSARGNSKVTKVDAFDISKGKGFISQVYKLTIHFTDNKEPFLSVLKVPGIESLYVALDRKHSEENDSPLNNKFASQVHNNECNFYNNFTDIPNLKIAKCYGAVKWNLGENEGALIMDYLNSTNIEFYNGFNIYQIKNVLNEISKLQTYFLALPNQGWTKDYKMLLTEKEFKQFSKVLLPHWEKVKTYVPAELYSGMEDEIIAMISNNDKIVKFVFNDLPEMDGNSKCLSHGDLWHNNICFRLDINGDVSNEVDAIIDWQMINAGSIGSDLARAVVLGCNIEVRRECETLLLPKYYQNLKEKVIKRGGKFDMTFEMFKLNYDYCMIDQSMQLLVTFPFPLANSKIPEGSGDELWDGRKYTLGSRIVFALKDAVKCCRILKPEWLVGHIESNL
uniref:CHK domain-containing protein n=1 Tax=Rhabditophanes sp. KR3021 TaxID=114890 RepID=A0AC35UAW3_9BILA